MLLKIMYAAIFSTLLLLSSALELLVYANTIATGYHCIALENVTKDLKCTSGAPLMDTFTDVADFGLILITQINS